MTEDPYSDTAAVARFSDAFAQLRAQVGRVIVGQDDVVEQIMLALAARGHVLLVGVPGLAKTLLISTVSRTLGLGFRRVQFTPDLMPADITGTEVLHSDPVSGDRSFRFVEGPVFTNILLADEINRTPPKTQAALLEAMQERQVSAAGETRPLPAPFFVLAPQNPIAQTGTYPLPEAALDRFLFLVKVDYPTASDESEILRRTTAHNDDEVQVVLNQDELRQLQGLVLAIPAADAVLDYAVALTRATRPDDETAPDFIRQWVNWGAGPRASQGLVLASKARALLQGRHHASVADIREVALPVLRHRISVNFAADAEGIDADTLITRLLDQVEAHTSTLDSNRGSSAS